MKTKKITKEKFISDKLHTWEVELLKYFPEKAYLSEFEDILNNMKENLC